MTAVVIGEAPGFELTTFLDIANGFCRGRLTEEAAIQTLWPAFTGAPEDKALNDYLTGILSRLHQGMIDRYAAAVDL